MINLVDSETHQYIGNTYDVVDAKFPQYTMHVLVTIYLIRHSSKQAGTIFGHLLDHPTFLIYLLFKLHFFLLKFLFSPLHVWWPSIMSVLVTTIITGVVYIFNVLY